MIKIYKKKEAIVNYIYKKVLLALALVSCGGSLFSYDWYLYNKTNKTLMVSMEMTGSMNQVYWFLVEPEGLAKFEWAFAYCYDIIKVVEYDRFEASKFNRRLGSLKSGAYGSSTKPQCTPAELKNPEASPCAASAQEVQDYFRQLIWHVPKIVYPKTKVDYENVIAVIKKIGAGVEKAYEFYKGDKKTKVDLGLGQLVSSMSGLVVESNEKGKCTTMTLDIYADDIVSVPGMQQKEPSYIFVKRLPK